MLFESISDVQRHRLGNDMKSCNMSKRFVPGSVLRKIAYGRVLRWHARGMHAWAHSIETSCSDTGVYFANIVSCLNQYAMRIRN